MLPAADFETLPPLRVQRLLPSRTSILVKAMPVTPDKIWTAIQKIRAQKRGAA